MTTPTPNRGYPAPTNSYSLGVPAALQGLAEAVDADLATFPPTIHTRPFFRLAASDPQKIAFATSARLQFTDVEEAVQDPFLNGPPVMPGDTFRLTAGVWQLTATFSYGAPGGGGVLDELLLRLFSTGIAGQLAGNSVHSTPNVADGSRTLSVTTLASFSPPDDVYAQIDFHKVDGINPTMYPIFGRSLTGLKVRD